MISPKTWYLNADRTKVVAEGDKTAQFLLVKEGHEISDADAEKYGLNVAAGVKPKTEPSPTERPDDGKKKHGK